MEKLTSLLESAAWRSSQPQCGVDLRSQAESAITDFLRMPNAVITSSGLHALSVALRTLGIKERDAVAVPAGTWRGIPELLDRLGATVIYYEVGRAGDLVTMPLTDPSQVHFALAIHTHARAWDVSRISAYFHNAVLVEDAAHCPGFRLTANRSDDDYAAASIVSFEATKPVTCLEEGEVSFNRAVDMQRATTIVDHDALGAWNNRSPEHRRPSMSVASCALLISQLEIHQEICSRRARGASFFLDLLNSRRVQYWVDRDVIERGSFYGVLIRSPDGDPDTTIGKIQTRSALVCDRHYLPYPTWTSANGAFPEAEMEYVEGVVVPHHAFLAESTAIERVAEGIT